MATDSPELSFGDNVSVRDTDLTRALGLAGLSGEVYGVTTGVVVIGECTADRAVNVHFGKLDKEFWFAPQLLQFIDHAPGTTVHVKGMSDDLVRTANGKWVPRRKPWWKFW